MVVDGRIITARSAGCAFDFALKLIEILAGSEKQRRSNMPSTTAEQKKQLRKSVRSLLTTPLPGGADGRRPGHVPGISFPAGGPADWHFFLFWGIAGLEPDTGSLAASLTKLGEDGLSAPGSPRLRDGVPGLPPGGCPWPSPTSASRSPRSRPL